MKIYFAGLAMVLACGKGDNSTPTQPEKSTTGGPTYTPPSVDRGAYRPLPINYNWKDVKCIAPINTGGDTFQTWGPLMSCSLEAQGMETVFGGFGPPTLAEGYQINIDTLSPIRAGYSSEWFHIENGWCWKEYDCTRTPMYERMEKAEKWDANKEGDETWYGWSFYVEKGSAEAQYQWMGQFQQHPSSKPVWLFGKNVYPYADWCAIYFEGGGKNNWNCNALDNYRLLDANVFHGVWHDVVFHAVWSSDPKKGLSDMWVDGLQVMAFRGKTLDPGNTTYFKYGIYRWTHNSRFTIYYDEVRKGKSESDVNIQMLTKK